MSKGRGIRQSPIINLKPVLAGLFVGLCAVSALQAGEVYQSVMQELARHENRLPGSEAFASSLAHLEQTLRAAGLEPHRQTYDTMVPETRECRLAIDGVDVAPVHALGPNGPANNTTGGKTLKGALVYLGSGSLQEMNGKPVEGCIAVLDFDSPNMMQVFSQGALAIVFVGDGTETQWQARQQFMDLEAELPRLFVHRADAERHGLLADGPRTAEVTITTVWKDVEGVNLWVEIPGEPGAKFNFDQEEAVVLTATLDTFGVVPALSPSVRTAANCALLAEVAVSLRERPLKRSVFAVWFGSHYAMQDGARMFYFAVRQGVDELGQRAGEFARVQRTSEERLAVLSAEDFFAQKNAQLSEVVSRVEKRMNASVSTLNYDLRVARDKQLPYRRMEDPLLPAEQAALASLEAQEAEIQSRRMSLNGMRRQFNDRAVTNTALFAEIAAVERRVIEREIADARNLLRHNQTHLELAARLSPRRIVMHADLDLANATGPWTLNMDAVGSQMFYHSMKRKWAELKLGDYVKHFLAVAGIHEASNGQSGIEGVFFADPATALVMPGKFCVPSLRSAPTRVAQALQVFGYQLLTVADPLDGDEMPYRQAVELEPLAPRLLSLVTGLATDPALSQVCPLAAPSLSKDSVMHFKGEGGFRYLVQARGSTELAGVPDDAIAFLAPRLSEMAPAIAGHSYSAASRVRASGHIFMPIIYSQPPMRTLGFDRAGSLRYFPTAGWNAKRLFYGLGGLVNAPLVPGSFGQVTGTLAGGKTDATLSPYLCRANGSFAFYMEEDEPFKVFAKGGLLLLGSTETAPRGNGIPIDGAPLYAFNVLRQTAHDYLILNESRLQILRDKAIVNDSLETLHADAEAHWEESVAARAETNIAKAVAHEAFSAGISARVAPALRDVTNDMVRAVVLLLILTLPFAFIMERLLISATSIYRQVLGFVGFFLASFILMYLVHPAFQVASSPMIIFLAFVIILLSSLVIHIVMSKFKKELRSMQGLGTSAHGVSSDSSTSMAAVLIGISGMRNRPLKTFLTGVTIILLTFAIVVFASFTPTSGVVKSYIGKGDGANRIELHRFSGLEIPRMLQQALSGLYARHWRTYAREAFFKGPAVENADDLLVVYRGANRSWQRLQAMVAFDPGEMSHDTALARALPGFSSYEGSLPPLFLYDKTAETMGLAVGERVTIGGKAFMYAGPFDASALDQLEYIDRSKVMPPDFESSKNELSQGQAGASDTVDLSDDTFVDTTRFTYHSARNVGITRLGALDELAGPEQPARMNGIIMYGGEGADVERTAEEIARMFVGPVMAKSATGANEFFFSSSLQATGFSVIVVPLLLGGLIIFNSLLGSIVEREKEIFTYSALGLSPPSVGALFFAESGVYAILGGMGGYLVSQLVAKGVAFGGEKGWFVPPEMNFSSLSSVMTSFVVMAMVMVSTIYPAIKAGRSANPGVARKWKMPAPVGDNIDFVFPFTVSADDMGGILAFILEHFENHGDAAIGNFATSEVSLFKQSDEQGLGLRANISLAPFDLGVMQAFSMYSRPSEIEGIDEVVVKLRRVSGTDGAWLRGNRVFVDDLREQFLLWRSLPISTVMHYRKQSEEIAH